METFINMISWEQLANSNKTSTWYMGFMLGSLMLVVQGQDYDYNI